MRGVYVHMYVACTKTDNPSSAFTAPTETVFELDEDYDNI